MVELLRTAFLLLALGLTAKAATNTPPIKELEGGRLEIGKVVVDRAQRSLTFPALVNMQTGVVEYAIVTITGKTHESVLKTEAEPFHIHTGMLLLGAKTAGAADPTVFTDRKKEIPGEHISIFVSWPDKVRQPIQSLVFNVVTKEPMKVPHWVYNGSVLTEGLFLAQREGSIVSLISDASALINNPREDRENDELWIANTNTVPAVGTPVQMTIQLPEP